MSKIFVKTSNTALLTESEDNKPVFEETIDTYKIIKKNNKFIIYEMDRKKNPRKVKTIKAGKKELINDVILKIQNNKIHLNKKHIEKIEGKIKRLDIIQTNYISRIKSRPQLIGLVKVLDTRRMIGDHYIGFSNKVKNIKPSKFELNQAKNEIISMAVGKFISDYGTAQKSGDIEASIIELRYQYYKTRIKQ